MLGWNRVETCSRSPPMWCIIVKTQLFTNSPFSLKFSNNKPYCLMMSTVANLKLHISHALFVFATVYEGSLKSEMSIIAVIGLTLKTNILKIH
ncbi:hypothetical protein QE152_g1042 [Popillia japonica]|uniref:Uncharacterized protein n=1 Tax=Popillia japonica TaxID=7064 RepID=A0AAW1N3X4_POPJA